MVRVSAAFTMSSNPEAQKLRKPIDSQKILETHPAFMSEIDPSNDDPAVAALQALKYESENPDANASSYKDEGNYHYKRKEFSKAIDSYTGGLRAKPTDVKLIAVLLTNRAICHWYLKNYRSCIRDCKSALEADPDHLKAYVKAVDACLALEKVDECLEFCERGLAKFPQCEQMTLAQMKALRLQMKTEKAAAVKSEMAQKELNTQLATLDIIRNRGINVNTSLQPISVPEAAGARFYVDPSNRFHWSVLFMYPEFGQTDFLQDVIETSTVLECLRLVFDPSQPPPSWDTQRLYCCSDDSLKVYFEDTVQTQKLVNFSPNLTIDRLTRRKDFSVRRDLLIVIHVISKNSAKFYERWKNELF
ncbi:Tetratricopeptide repeat protein 4 [Paragonimus westermani]|uniref:Tetratricopeptide repeat protein 4 n=1 Tax=Paragonimus westermani TaxID=34504 RepID=A0A8T0DL20_9TREM|nr:Tetratricopeptide repeat protein 4 [Paragonimus westermani]